MGIERIEDWTRDADSSVSGDVVHLRAHTPRRLEPLRPGQRVGRYVVLERLGAGGMGVVYAAHDPVLDRTVAVKLLPPQRPTPGASTEDVLREGRVMAQLSHPGVVAVHDAGVLADGVVYLVLDHIDGRSARQWLREERPDWRRALEVLTGAGRGLAAAHAAGIVHRDVKPANVLVGRNGRASLADFGLALAARVDDTDTCASAGTPSYMAPEQHDGRTPDARADQFSFCVLLYEAVYGERPFEPENLPDVPPAIAMAVAVTVGEVRPAPKGSSVPASLRRILLRGLAVDPEDRWPSMEALLEALDGVEAPRPPIGGLAVTAAEVLVGAAAALVGVAAIVALV